MALIDRAKNMILIPRTEWPIVAGEPTTVGGLYTGYIIPLAGAAAVAAFIGRLIIIHSLVGNLVVGVLGFVLGLVMMYVMALIASAVAPSFGGQKDTLEALKWIAYSSTAAWVGGIANIIPILGALVALVGALYSLYLLYLGVGPTMRVPQDKIAGYAVVIILCYIVLSVVIGVVVYLTGIGSTFNPGTVHTTY